MATQYRGEYVFKNSLVSRLVFGQWRNQSLLSSELQALLAEMRLLLPNNVIHVAEIVAAVSYALAQTSSAFPMQIRLALGGAVTDSLSVFVNTVRQEVGLPYYVPKNVSLGDMPKVLQELADKQRSRS
jgi:hypothetical protein